MFPGTRPVFLGTHSPFLGTQNEFSGAIRLLGTPWQFPGTCKFHVIGWDICNLHKKSEDEDRIWMQRDIEGHPASFFYKQYSILFEGTRRKRVACIPITAV